MQTIRNLGGRDRFLVAITLLVLTCATPSQAWCASSNLWVGFVAQDGIESYTSKQLKKSGMPTPTYLSTYGTASGLAFDKSRDLWVVAEEDEVVEFTPVQLKNLKNDPNPTPGVIITSTATFGQLSGCNFDHQGNMWVTNPGNSAIYELSKAQLDAGSGEVTPPIVITSPEMDGSLFVTFDADGNAWLPSQFDNTVLEFSASQLTSSGSKSPTVVLSDDGSGTSIYYPEELAFDKNGNLWVPNYFSDTVVEYAKDQLTATGNPAPAVKLSSAIFNGPWGLAFNPKGSLAIVNYRDGAIAIFTEKQIKTSGAPIPKVSLTGTHDENFQTVFGPSS